MKRLKKREKTTKIDLKVALWNIILVLKIVFKKAFYFTNTRYNHL
jgi:hypothetical protein